MAVGLLVILGSVVAGVLATQGSELASVVSSDDFGSGDSQPDLVEPAATAQAPNPTTAGRPTPIPAAAPDPAAGAVPLSVGKEATVFIYAEYADGTARGGSGALVDRSHVLTNRHVVEDADILLVAVSPQEDAPATLRYSARLLDSHPYLDIAVIELVGAHDGGGFDGWDGDVLPLASSAPLRAGDEVTALGFPALTSSSGRDAQGRTSLPSVSVSRGQIVTFDVHPGCSAAQRHPDLLAYEECAPEGAIDRGRILTDDLSGSGGSGGPVITEAGLVAVRYAVRTPSEGTISTGGVAVNVPVDLFVEWLLDRIA